MHFSDNHHILTETPGSARLCAGWASDWLVAGGGVPCDWPVSTRGGWGVGSAVAVWMNRGLALTRRLRPSRTLFGCLVRGSRVGVIQCTATLGHSFSVQQNIHSLSVSVKSQNTEKKLASIVQLNSRGGRRLEISHYFSLWIIYAPATETSYFVLSTYKLSHTV